MKRGHGNSECTPTASPSRGHSAIPTIIIVYPLEQSPAVPSRTLTVSLLNANDTALHQQKSMYKGTREYTYSGSTSHALMPTELACATYVLANSHTSLNSALLPARQVTPPHHHHNTLLEDKLLGGLEGVFRRVLPTLSEKKSKQTRATGPHVIPQQRARLP